MKHTEKEATPDYLDVIYTNRHKAYGSYELRRRYPARLKLAMSLVMAAVGLLAVIPLLGSKKQTTTFVKPVLRADTLAAIIHDKKFLEKLPEPKQSAQPKTNKATQSFTTPTVVPDKLVKEPVVALDSLKGKEIGNSTHEGKESDGSIGGAKTGTTSGKGTGTLPTPEPPVMPLRVAETAPAPPYSVEAFLSKNLRYPDAAREQGEEGKVMLEFVVHEDGHIGQPRILRSAGKALDAEALRVLSLMPAWNPGMQGGKAVKVYFVLPITFRLD